MIAEQKEFFRNLELYCEVRRDPVSTPHQRRYIAGDEASDSDLKEMEVHEKIQFGRHRALCRIVKGDAHYVGVLGFEFAGWKPQLEAVDVSSGAFVGMV